MLLKIQRFSFFDNNENQLPFATYDKNLQIYIVFTTTIQHTLYFCCQFVDDILFRIFLIHTMLARLNNSAPLSNNKIKCNFVNKNIEINSFG